MKVLLCGKQGQLGLELQLTCPSDIKLVALEREQCDLTSEEKISQCIAREKPDVLINAAAYTAVDQAETDRETAFAVNGYGVDYLSKACQAHQVRLLHVSTDYVFDGENHQPYQPEDTPNPQSVYGESKLLGERAIQENMEDYFILRTAWVYSKHRQNFVKTMLRLLNEKEALNIVSDQVGTPTWARHLAKALWQAVKTPEVKGIYHFSDAGVASWYDFTCAIQDIALEKGLLKKTIPVNPIPTQAYPLPAKRPYYAVFDKTATWKDLSVQPVHWRRALIEMMQELEEK